MTGGRRADISARTPLEEAGVRYRDASAECHGLSSYRPHAESYGSGRRRSPQADAGIQHALAAGNGSRGHRHAVCRGAGTAQRGL